MPSSSNLFKINGSGLSELFIEAQALGWRSASSENNEGSTNSKKKDNSQQKQRIEFAQLIAIRRYYATPKSHKTKRKQLDGSDKYLDNDRRTIEDDSSSNLSGSDDCSTVDVSTLPRVDDGFPKDERQLARDCDRRRLKKLKIYYVKRSERKGPSKKLLKVKKISIELRHKQKDDDPAPAMSDIGASATSSARTLSEYAHLLEQQLEHQRQLRPKRLLIFVNPFGGKGKALHLFRSRSRRLLELAQVDFELIVTKYANHARETIQNPEFSLAPYDGIVCVGGDGMFAELMNGLLHRFNRDNLTSAGDSRHQAPKSTTNISRSLQGQRQQELQKFQSTLGGLGLRFESPTLPIGVIGAGSTDANLFGFIGTNDVVTATLNIVLGQQLQIDVCSVHSLDNDRLLRFVSTFVAYGYFGDVVRESEKLRWLGPSRYDVTGVNNLIKNRAYDGLVRIWLSAQDGSPQDSPRCNSNCSLCSRSDAEEKPENDPAKESLELIECRGPFIGVNAAVTACRCPQTKKGFSPGNHLANGCADLILVKPCSRIQYVNYLLRTAGTAKSAFDLKFVTAYRCRQFEFLVDTNQNKTASSTFRGPPAASSEEDFSLPDESSGLGSASTTSSSDKSNSLESSGIEGRNISMDAQNDTTNNNIDRLGHDLSSWNADGEIIREQSIRVKVNRRLLRVFGTGEPELL